MFNIIRDVFVKITCPRARPHSNVANLTDDLDPYQSSIFELNHSVQKYYMYLWQTDRRGRQNNIQSDL